MTFKLESITDEDLHAFATIAFSRPMNEEALDRMFGFIGDEIKAEIGYTVERSKLTGPRLGQRVYFADSGPATQGIKVSGRIMINLTLRPNGPIGETFTCFREQTNRDPTTVDAMQVNLTPGYKVADLARTGTLEIINELRDAVKAYEGGTLD